LKGASPVREQIISPADYLIHSLGSGFDSLVTHPKGAFLQGSFFVALRRFDNTPILLDHHLDIAPPYTLKYKYKFMKQTFIYKKLAKDQKLDG